MIEKTIDRNDKLAFYLIGTISLIVFIAVAVLSKVQVKTDLGFDVHVFARLNAIINSLVSVLLLAGLYAVKQKHYFLHRTLMFVTISLSALFLISYIFHHLFAGETKYGGEGTIRYVYLFILITHIILAAVILPFILYTTYRALTGEYKRHRKIARWTWPLWLYVSVTGVLVYLMISPYYNYIK